MNSNKKDIETMHNKTHAVSSIMNGIFACVLFVFASILYKDNLDVGGDNTTLLFMSVGFFIASFFLAKRVFPQLSQTHVFFGFHVKPGFLFGVMYICIAISMMYFHMHHGFMSWINLFFAVVFAFVGMKDVIDAMK